MKRNNRLQLVAAARQKQLNSANAASSGTYLSLEQLEKRDLLSTLQFSSPTYSIAENAGMATITVLRVGGSAGTVTVDYSTSDGTATHPHDYFATSGTLTFSDGQTSQTIQVPIIDDDLTEGVESVNVTLSNPTGGANLGSPQASILYIQDDESPAPDVGAHTLAYTHWNAPAGKLSTVQMATQASGSTLLAWVARGYIETFTAATVPTDNKGNTSVQLDMTHDYAPLYANSGFALYNFPSFKGGEGSVFSVPMPVNDEVTLIVLEVVNGGLIQDLKYNRVEVGNPQTSLSVTTTGPATLVAFWTGDSPFGATSTVPNNGFTLREHLNFGFNDAIQASVATKVVSEPGTYNVTWNVTPAQAAMMYLLAIQYVPIPQHGTLQFNSSQYSVNEDDGTATITVTRTGGSAGAISVDYATSDGSATAGIDYTAMSGTLHFADGQTSQTITIPIIDDMLAEGDETFNVFLTNPSGGAKLGSIGTATVTIVDNDGPQIQSVVVNGGEIQRSMVTSIRVLFSEAVSFPNGINTAFQLERTGFGSLGVVALNAVQSGAEVTLTFAAGGTVGIDPRGSLSDGMYKLTVIGSKVQGIGGTMNLDATLNVHRLFGDIDGDGSVTAIDFSAFRLAYGNSGSSIFDFDGDNEVSAADFNQFRMRYGLNITP
jgi:hypothetical protein